MPAMQPIRVTDLSDPRIAAYRDIREADLVGREGLFVAEGTSLLLSAREAGWVPKILLFLAGGQQTEVASELLDRGGT